MRNTNLYEKKMQTLNIFGPLVPRASTEDWYDKLEKSALSPPNFLFGIVWSILYPLQAALGLELLFNDPEKFVAFLIQSIARDFWPILFFRRRKIQESSGLLNVLTIANWLLLREFLVSRSLNLPLKIRLVLLQAPYTFWLTFASYLNTYIASNNPGA